MYDLRLTDLFPVPTPQKVASLFYPYISIHILALLMLLFLYACQRNLSAYVVVLIIVFAVGDHWKESYGWNYQGLYCGFSSPVHIISELLQDAKIHLTIVFLWINWQQYGKLSTYHLCSGQIDNEALQRKLRHIRHKLILWTKYR
jgi:hypothetical protein